MTFVFEKGYVVSNKSIWDGEIHELFSHINSVLEI